MLLIMFTSTEHESRSLCNGPEAYRHDPFVTGQRPTDTIPL